MRREVDTADVSPCPGCAVPVRRFSAIRTGPWWCADCIQAKCGGARAGVRPVVDRPAL